MGLQVSISTIKDRIRRGVPDSELNKPAGEKNCKIDAAMALKIWRDLQWRISRGKSKTSISVATAEKFGVSLSIVSNIRCGNTWNDVTGLPRKNYKKPSKA